MATPFVPHVIVAGIVQAAAQHHNVAELDRDELTQVVAHEMWNGDPPAMPELRDANRFEWLFAGAFRP